MSTYATDHEDPQLRMVEQHWAALRGALDKVRPHGPTVRAWGRRLAAVLGGGGRLLTCGNGGSAAEAQHLSGELVGRFRGDRPPFSAIALHADTSAGTAIANDYGEHEFFARQVRAHGRKGDVLVCLSTSGTSPNVVAAAKAAHDIGVTTYAMTGPPPNPLAALCDDAIAVEADDVATVQEVHLTLVHTLCAVFDDEIGAVA